MLLVEWLGWWDAIPGLEAQEALNLHHVLFVSDSGWKLDDRPQMIEDWQRRAQGARAHVPVPEPRAQSPSRQPIDPADQRTVVNQTDARPEVESFMRWLHTRFGGDPRWRGGFSASYASDGPPDEVPAA
jgi:hypothetical protein